MYVMMGFVASLELEDFNIEMKGQIENIASMKHSIIWSESDFVINRGRFGKILNMRDQKPKIKIVHIQRIPLSKTSISIK